MKKWIRILSILLMTVIVMPGLIYLGLAIYYQDSFMYGTWINGIYCTGKTVDEVNQELLVQYEHKDFYVITPHDVETINPEEFSFDYDFTKSLELYRKKQNPLVWYLHMFSGHQNEEILPEISFDKQKLEDWILTIKSYESNLEMIEDSLSIVLGENGYEIREDKEQILNTKLAVEKITEAIECSKTEIDLVEEECYFTRDETIEMQQVRDLYEEVKAVQEVSLQYQIKDNIKTVSQSEIAMWIATDSEGKVLTDKTGKLIFDKDAVSMFVKELADKYDTWQKFPFVTHNGNEIVLTKGNYGIKIYQQKEVNALMDYLKNPVDMVREPAYIRDITYQDKSAIDTTYVEVDMTMQKMMFFSEGEKVFETDVVTGCTAQGMGTPELVCFVYGKSRNAILKGKNYRSFVNYWVPVYGGIGLHDATWRDKFGGEIYIKSGSHGCINTPLERMAELYDMLEIGMPVVIHY